MPGFIPSIGMEVHAELSTRSKMFCRCPVGFGGEPNTRCCPICTGMPGTLPIPNRAAIEMVLRTALALNCTIAMDSIFHRKNYFYPDLPKGYQVSQYGDTNPLGYGGWLDIPASNGGTKRIGIRRVHLEEDTGKLMHLPGGGSGIDFNRAGVPLMEIVTDFPPDITNAEEAKEYLVQLRQLLLYLGVCDGKMEEGSLRCEPNISVRAEGTEKLGTKTELKNLNSFRSVQLGVGFEIDRQSRTIQEGGTILQETRGWNEATESSYVMRVKETEMDYRYFPDPDLVPMTFVEAEIAALRQTIPELPLARSTRYQTAMGLSEKEAWQLVAEPNWATYFEDCVRLGGEPKPIWNLMNSELRRRLNESGTALSETSVTPAHLVELANLLKAGQINSKQGKEVFEVMFGSGKMPTEIVEEQGGEQVSDSAKVAAWIEETLKAHPDVVAKFKGGQSNVKGFLVGQIMRLSQGKANPELVQRLLNEALER